MSNYNSEITSAKIDVSHLGKRSERIKLKFTDENYQVNPAKKTTTCILTFEISYPFSISDTRVSIENDYYGNIIPTDSLTAVGVSHCNGSDVFNTDKGKKIAKARAENKAYAHVNKILKDRIASFDRISELMHYMNAQFNLKAAECIKHNIDYIEKVSQ